MVVQKVVVIVVVMVMRIVMIIMIIIYMYVCMYVVKTFITVKLKNDYCYHANLQLAFQRKELLKKKT